MPTKVWVAVGQGTLVRTFTGSNNPDWNAVVSLEVEVVIQDGRASRQGSCTVLLLKRSGGRLRSGVEQECRIVGCLAAIIGSNAEHDNSLRGRREAKKRESAYAE